MPVIHDQEFVRRENSSRYGYLSGNASTPSLQSRFQTQICLLNPFKGARQGMWSSYEGASLHFTVGQLPETIEADATDDDFMAEEEKEIVEAVISKVSRALHRISLKAASKGLRNPLKASLQGPGKR